MYQNRITFRHAKNQESTIVDRLSLQKPLPKKIYKKNKECFTTECFTVVVNRKRKQFCGSKIIIYYPDCNATVKIARKPSPATIITKNPSTTGRRRKKR